MTGYFPTLRSAARCSLTLLFLASACTPTSAPQTAAPAVAASPAAGTFDPSLADQLVPGQTTLAEATQLLGAPSRVRGFGGGQTLARWSYTRFKESAALDVMFAKDGKMLSIVRRQ